MFSSLDYPVPFVVSVLYISESKVIKITHDHQHIDLMKELEMIFGEKSLAEAIAAENTADYSQHSVFRHPWYSLLLSQILAVNSKI